MQLASLIEIMDHSKYVSICGVSNKGKYIRRYNFESGLWEPGAKIGPATVICVKDLKSKKKFYKAIVHSTIISWANMPIRSLSTFKDLNIEMPFDKVTNISIEVGKFNDYLVRE